MKKRIEKIYHSDNDHMNVLRLLDKIDALIEAQEEMEKDIKQLQVVVEIQSDDLQKIRNADLKPVSEPKEECTCSGIRFVDRENMCKNCGKPITPDHTELREKVHEVLEEMWNYVPGEGSYCVKRAEDKILALIGK